VVKIFFCVSSLFDDGLQAMVENNVVIAGKSTAYLVIVVYVIHKKLIARNGEY
jgi:hypothetical protein